MLYDDQAIYFGIRCYEQIRKPSWRTYAVPEARSQNPRNEKRGSFLSSDPDLLAGSRLR